MNGANSTNINSMNNNEPIIINLETKLFSHKSPHQFESHIGDSAEKQKIDAFKKSNPNTNSFNTLTKWKGPINRTPNKKNKQPKNKLKKSKNRANSQPKYNL
jgi:hypothetical protein